MTQDQAHRIAATLPRLDAIRFLRRDARHSFKLAAAIKTEMDARAPWHAHTLASLAEHPLTNAERRLAGLPPDSYRTNYPRHSIARD